MIYGYIRVSTEQQNPQNQAHEIAVFADGNHIKIDSWMRETVSSRKPLTERKLNELLNKLKKDDVLIATELSRLGRNLMEVMGILQHCLEKGCQVWTLKENYRLGADIQSKVLAFAFGLASEIERQLISERTKESLKRAKAEGKRLGRPRGSTYRKLRKKHEQIMEMLQRNASQSEIARAVNCSWNTVHRYIRELFRPVSAKTETTDQTKTRGHGMDGKSVKTCGKFIRRQMRRKAWWRHYPSARPSCRARRRLGPRLSRRR